MATKSITMDITISGPEAVEKIIDALLDGTSIKENRDDKALCKFGEIESEDIDKYY